MEVGSAGIECGTCGTVNNSHTQYCFTCGIELHPTPMWASLFCSWYASSSGMCGSFDQL